MTVQQLFKVMIALNMWYLPPALIVASFTVKIKLWSNDHDMSTCNWLTITTLQYPEVMWLPFVTFTTSFWQAKSMGKLAISCKSWSCVHRKLWLCRSHLISHHTPMLPSNGVAGSNYCHFSKNYLRNYDRVEPLEWKIGSLIFPTSFPNVHS